MSLRARRRAMMTQIGDAHRITLYLTVDADGSGGSFSVSVGNTYFTETKTISAYEGAIVTLSVSANSQADASITVNSSVVAQTSDQSKVISYSFAATGDADIYVTDFGYLIEIFYDGEIEE